MRKLPTRLKEIRGTARKDRQNLREPRPPLGIPPPRRGLSVAARGWYRRLARLLHDMSVLTLADGPALELLAETLAEYTQARRLLARDGQSYECATTAGAVMRRTRPEQAVAADAGRRAAHLLEQFGLTPVSRSKVEGATAPPVDDFLTRFQGQRRVAAAARPGKPDPERFFRPDHV